MSEATKKSLIIEENTGDGFRLSDLETAKLRALAEFAAGAGHEINNPVATIIGRATQLLRSEENPNRQYALTTIVSQAYRIRDMIGDLMAFAQPPVPTPEAFDVVALFADVIKDREREERQFAFRAAGPMQVWADPAQIGVAFAELLQNAIEATEQGGDIEITCTLFDQNVLCEVMDRGIGFSEAEREHAFDPFYSARQAGRGLGFGLPKAWRIITMAGGIIGIRSSATTTTICVTLPRYADRIEALNESKADRET